MGGGWYACDVKDSQLCVCVCVCVSGGVEGIIVGSYEGLSTVPYATFFSGRLEPASPWDKQTSGVLQFPVERLDCFDILFESIFVWYSVFYVWYLTCWSVSN